MIIIWNDWSNIVHLLCLNNFVFKNDADLFGLCNKRRYDDDAEQDVKP